MITRRPSSIVIVAARHLCTGCGACAGLAPGQFRMKDVASTGRRPVRISQSSNRAAERGALAVCPGTGTGPRPVPVTPPSPDAPRKAEWGTVLEVWEGHAADPQLRWRGSSGGAVTAIAAFAIESGAATGAVHVRQSKSDVLTNEAVISRSREELIAAAGSRYSPASPCERLGDIAQSPGPLVFIGKPCDVQAAAATAKLNPDIGRKLALTISIFCAGTPSSNGTRALVAALGVPTDATVTALRYRGEGWPGTMMAQYRNADGSEMTSRSLTYEEGWGGILQKHRQWRCHVCADHTGEFADLSIGDPWDRPRGGADQQGSSLIIVRTARGGEMLRRAIATGAIVAEQRPFGTLAAAQPNLVRARRILFGRLLGLRILGLSAPRYEGWNLGRLWFTQTSTRDKIASVLGTVKRALHRRLRLAEDDGGGAVG